MNGPFLCKHVTLAWSQVVSTLTSDQKLMSFWSDQIKLNSKSSTRMSWLLALYFKPTVFSLSVPALLLYSNVSKTCSISFAAGGSLFTVTLTSSKCGKVSCWACSGGISSCGTDAAKCSLKWSLSLSLEIDNLEPFLIVKYFFSIANSFSTSLATAAELVFSASSE